MLHTHVIKVLVSILADTVKIMNYLETSICLIYSDQMIQSFSGYEGKEGTEGTEGKEGEEMAELGAGNARRVNVRKLALPGSFVVVFVLVIVIVIVVETFSDFILYFITYISYSPYHTL